MLKELIDEALCKMIPCYFFSDGKFKYPNGPNIFKTLDFGIDMNSRGKSTMPYEKKN